MIEHSRKQERRSRYIEVKVYVFSMDTGAPLVSRDGSSDRRNSGRKELNSRNALMLPVNPHGTRNTFSRDRQYLFRGRQVEGTVIVAAFRHIVSSESAEKVGLGVAFHTPICTTRRRRRRPIITELPVRPVRMTSNEIPNRKIAQPL
ncbi:Uncharacterized protein DBV15_01220 [Temnothorax longispinosus]|uniref:Uncharacterized protein n=1 Tax=Temnothorax longispinosus TaxID=300112 RepID=A0A4S2J9E7_9HYME|nr:Uncharacterized protein DBV15_01220 [Temnothorax longispinosus]